MFFPLTKTVSTFFATWQNPYVEIKVRIKKIMCFFIKIQLCVFDIVANPNISYKNASREK